MARTKIVACRNYNQRKRNFQHCNQNQEKNLRPSGGTGRKNIENQRDRNYDIKIKKILAQFKKVEIKYTG